MTEGALRAFLAGLLTLTVACGETPADPSLPADCVRPSALSVERIVGCLNEAHRLSDTDLEVALAEIAAARRVADSLEGTGIYDDLLRGRFVLRALQHVADLYDEAPIRDSARIHRLLDHVAVSAAFVRGELVQEPDGYWLTQRTPGIAWIYLPNVGIYPDPAGTVTRLLGPGPASLEPPLSAIEPIGEALWSRAVPISATSDAPVWEWYFPAISCSVFLLPPRRSAAIQTAALRLFTELSRRTGDARWIARAESVLESFRTGWDEGGVRLVNRKGAWWEEADPRAQFWRAAAGAAVAVGDLAEQTGNADTRALADEGILAARLAAPRYDDGVWTRDCLGGGYQDRDNHRLFIRLADALFERTGDPFWSALRDRWSSLVPPPGFAVTAPAP